MATSKGLLFYTLFNLYCINVSVSNECFTKKKGLVNMTWKSYGVITDFPHVHNNVCFGRRSLERFRGSTFYTHCTPASLEFAIAAILVVIFQIKHSHEH